MKSFVKMFFSNTEVLESTKFKIIVIALIFLINVSLISTPNFFGKMESINSITDLSNIEEAFTEMYEDNLNCYIENTEMICDIDDGLSYQGYDVIYTEEFLLDDVDSSTIYFTKEAVAIYYVTDRDQVFSLVGNYRLLDGFDFRTISSEDTGDLTQNEYYLQVTDSTLSAIYYSTLDQHLMLIYLGQFLQTVIYVFVVSSLFMLMNFKAKTRKLSYLNSFKIIITSMTGPALLVAIIALINPSLGSLLFFIIYAIRAMLIYYKINFSDNTYTD